VLGGGEPFKVGSGRKELAEAVASPTNPLTARVFVNRVWAHHFGKGLVDTPSDFGFRSNPPSHPELLDWRAATFVEEGWSVKALHRRIVLSSTYRLRSEEPRGDAAERGESADPDNRLLAHANRRRLDFESMRDAMLAATGGFDAAVGGRPVDLSAEPFTGRRTLYGLIDRLNLDPMFATFDFASPDVTAAERSTTMVPQQALFAMNHPFVIERARAVCAGDAFRSGDDAAKAGLLYRALFQRPPTQREMLLATEFVRSTPRGGEDDRGVWRYGCGDPAAAAGSLQQIRRCASAQRGARGSIACGVRIAPRVPHARPLPRQRPSTGAATGVRWSRPRQRCPQRWRTRCCRWELRQARRPRPQRYRAIWGKAWGARWWNLSAS
jgi:hypothetical protein